MLTNIPLFLLFGGDLLVGAMEMRAGSETRTPSTATNAEMRDGQEMAGAGSASTDYMFNGAMVLSETGKKGGRKSF